MAKKPRRPPPMYPLSPSETAFQMALVRFLKVALPPQVVFFHCPNGGLRDTATAGQLKAMGVLPGVYDLGFIWPNGQVSWLELKVGKNGLEDDQITFGERVRANHCATATAWTIEEAVAIIERWCAAYGLQMRARLTGRAAA